jgi:hypothetical protein
MFRLILLGLITTVLSSPFEITQKYIEEFKSGIETLKKTAHEHTFKEENFDFDLHNETEAGTQLKKYIFYTIMSQIFEL